MKNLSVQKEFGYCNVHTLINVLRDKDFEELFSNEAFKSGDVDSMTEMMQLCGYPEWSMRALIGVSDLFPPIPKSYLIDILTCDIEDSMVEKLDIELPIIPYFLTVQIKEPHWHSVALLRCKDKYLYMEPKNENIIKLDSINDITNHFKKCIGVERIEQEFPEGKKYIILAGENLGYDEILK